MSARASPISVDPSSVGETARVVLGEEPNSEIFLQEPDVMTEG
jgi:hypothetical protein